MMYDRMDLGLRWDVGAPTTSLVPGPRPGAVTVTRHSSPGQGPGLLLSLVTRHLSLVTGPRPGATTVTCHSSLVTRHSVPS
jgi:hypothetical protein